LFHWRQKNVGILAVKFAGTAIAGFLRLDYFPAMNYGAIHDMLLMMISSQEVSFD